MTKELEAQKENSIEKSEYESLKAQLEKESEELKQKLESETKVLHERYEKALDEINLLKTDKDTFINERLNVSNALIHAQNEASRMLAEAAKQAEEQKSQVDKYVRNEVERLACFQKELTSLKTSASDILSLFTSELSEIDDSVNRLSEDFHKQTSRLFIIENKPENSELLVTPIDDIDESDASSQEQDDMAQDNQDEPEANDSDVSDDQNDDNDLSTLFHNFIK